jgi:hypothetical protein
MLKSNEPPEPTTIQTSSRYYGSKVIKIYNNFF